MPCRFNSRVGYFQKGCCYGGGPYAAKDFAIVVSCRREQACFDIGFAEDGLQEFNNKFVGCALIIEEEDLNIASRMWYIQHVSSQLR